MLPTPYTLLVRRWSEGEPNPHGNTTNVYSEPEPLPAHAIAPGASLEAIAAGRNTTEIAWTVYAPEGTIVRARDLITFDGVEYEVIGDSKTFAFAPWGNHVSGVTIELKKQEG